MDLTAVILAGGKSSRMGTDKGLLIYRGKRMVEHVAAVCRRITTEIYISTTNPDYNFLGYKLIPDNFKEAGPIGGIQAALKLSETETTVFCPCDMPNLQPEVLQKIIAESESELATVAAAGNGKVFPVLGCYKKAALPVIEAQIKKGDFKLQHLLKELNAKIVEVPASKLLMNVNYPEDLK